MNRPNFEPIFTSKSDFCEKSSSKPVSSFVPKQAIPLAELVARFEKGQRLNVHMNFREGENMQSLTDEEALNQIRTENIDSDDFPPMDVHDIVDVHNCMQENETHKKEFQARMKKKKEEAQKAKVTKAPQANDTTPPPAE